MKLSNLVLKDKFKFLPNQTAKYLTNTGSILADLETNSFMEFEVLKKNKLTVLCKSGFIEYYFKFQGELSYTSTAKNTKKNMNAYIGVDCSVELIQ